MRSLVADPGHVRLFPLLLHHGGRRFHSGGKFSLGTVHLLLSGGWMRGVASHAALTCLLLAVAVFFLTRKNLYCATLCPFGAVQEGLGRITGCSPRGAPRG